MEGSVGQFAGKLLEKQGSMSGAQFARLLGIEPADLSRIRNGRREPSKATINAALARWPDLAYLLAEDAKASQHLAANEF